MLNHPKLDPISHNRLHQILIKPIPSRRVRHIRHQRRQKLRPLLRTQRLDPLKPQHIILNHQRITHRRRITRHNLIARQCNNRTTRKRLRPHPSNRVRDRRRFQHIRDLKHHSEFTTRRVHLKNNRIKPRSLRLLDPSPHRFACHQINRTLNSNDRNPIRLPPRRHRDHGRRRNCILPCCHIIIIIITRVRNRTKSNDNAHPKHNPVQDTQR